MYQTRYYAFLWWWGRGGLFVPFVMLVAYNSNQFLGPACEGPCVETNTFYKFILQILSPESQYQEFP